MILMREGATDGFRLGGNTRLGTQETLVIVDIILPTLMCRIGGDTRGRGDSQPVDWQWSHCVPHSAVSAAKISLETPSGLQCIQRGTGSRVQDSDCVSPNAESASTGIWSQSASASITH